MNVNAMPDHATDAVIYLKDGKRKYGTLLDSGSEEHYHFLDNESDQLEIVPAVMIDAIDVHLK